MGRAFIGLEKIVQERIGVKSIGFGSQAITDSDEKIHQVLAKIVPKDLIKYGFIPEFIGRLPIVAVLHELDTSALENKMKKKNRREQENKRKKKQNIKKVK